VLWKSDLIPGAAFAARKGISPELKEAFLKALLSINKNRGALEKIQIRGFIPAQDSDYDEIRKLEILK